MTDETTPAPVVVARRRVPFFGHQFAEYVVAVALIAVGFHSSGGAEVVLAAAGILLVLLNVVTTGPLGAFSFLSRRSHHAGDFAVAAVLIVAPFFVASRLHAGGIVLSEAVGALVLWMERATRYAPPIPTPAQSADGRSGEPGVIESVGIVTAMVTPEAAKAARRAARHAGILAGVTRRVVREHRAERRQSGA